MTLRSDIRDLYSRSFSALTTLAERHWNYHLCAEAEINEFNKLKSDISRFTAECKIRQNRPNVQTLEGIANMIEEMCVYTSHAGQQPFQSRAQRVQRVKRALNLAVKALEAAVRFGA